MSMTKGDFEAIAHVIALQRTIALVESGDPVDYIDDIAKGIADRAEQTNDLFDRARFLAAATVGRTL